MTDRSCTLAGLDGATVAITDRTTSHGRTVTVIEYRNGLSPFAYISCINPMLQAYRDSNRGPELWVEGLFVSMPEASAAAAAEFLGIPFA